MKIIGTSLLPLVFPPVDRVFRARVRVVEDLPVGLILGAAFMRRYNSVLFFEGGGWFKPTRDSARVPMLDPKPRPTPRPWREDLNVLQGPEGEGATSVVPGWKAAKWGIRSGRKRCQVTGKILTTDPNSLPATLPPVSQDTFCSLEWRAERGEEPITPPPEVLSIEALDLGSTAWEDGSSLRWPVVVTTSYTLEGRVSIEVDAHLLGPQPYTAQLLLVFPLKPFDLEGDAGLCIAKGVQWWRPGSAPKIKLVNRTTLVKTLAMGVQVATAYATNCDDVERMLLLKDPTPTPASSRDEKPYPSPTAPDEEPDPGVRVTNANTGQLNHEYRSRLLEILQKFNLLRLFPKNNKIVPVLHGREVSIPLIDENVRPVACKQQVHNPVQAAAINKQVDIWLEADVVDYSNSGWCARTVLSKKSNGDLRLCIDYRGLNALTKKDSGGLGTLATMHHRVKGSKFFTLLDIPSAYHHLLIRKEDRKKTAFRDARGRLYEFKRCGFGLTTVPAVFSAHLGDTLRPVLDKGVEKWLDDILLYSETLDEHLTLIDEVLTLLHKAGYTVHFDKCEFCFSEVEFLGVMVGREGVRPAPSKVEALKELEMPATVGEVRSFLGLAGYLRNFVPNFSGLTAPITDLLRDKSFSSRKARSLPVPWGPAQTEAFHEIIRALTTHPVLATPDWQQPFTLHTDASELAAGAVLTQSIDGREAPLGYASHRFTRSEEKLSPNDREVLAVLYALDQFRTYLQHREFTLVTDCAALTWLFTSQHLSPKMHRWALRMNQYNIILKWRKGTDHTAPDALSRLRRKGSRDVAIDTSFPDDDTSPMDDKGASGPVLDGVPLRSLASSEDGDGAASGLDHAPSPSHGGGGASSAGVVSPPLHDGSGAALAGGDKPVLDGIPLAAVGPAHVNSLPDFDVVTLYALHITPEIPADDDIQRLRDYREVRATLSPRLPRAVILGCGAGGALLALKDILLVEAAIDPDWVTLECARANSWGQDTRLVRAPLTSDTCLQTLSDARPEIIIGNACRRYDALNVGQPTVGHASDIVETFIRSRAQLLILECPSGFARTEAWNDRLRPTLEHAKCAVEEATVSAADVGVPTGKRRVFIVAIRSRGDGSFPAKLARWKDRLQRRVPRTPTVGAFLGRKGWFFLKRPGEKSIFTFDGPAITITHAHILGLKPPESQYTPHRADDGPLSETENLSWEDFTRLTTAQESFQVPPTVRKTDAAWALEEFTLPPMLREVVNSLGVHGVVKRHEDIRKGIEEELLDLANLWFASTNVVAPIDTTLLQKPRFEVTPAVTRSASRRSRMQTLPAAPSEPPTTTPPAASTPSALPSPPTPVAPTSTPPIVSDVPPTLDVPDTAHVPMDTDDNAEVPIDTTVPAEQSITPVPDVSGPTPLGQDQSQLRHDDASRRGCSAELSRMEDTLRDRTRLVDAQRKDDTLRLPRSRLEAGQGEDGDYLLDDHQLLWHAPRGRAYAIALPRQLVPAVLALVHGTYGHPGVARTTMLIERKYHWPTLKKDTRAYVLSCKCRRRKRAWSRQLAMIPARLLQPWEVLEMDIQDMKVTSDTGNRYLLVVVDRASKFLAAFPLPTKQAIGVSRKLLELLLIFGLPLSIRCDPGGEFTAEVMSHLCRWLKVSLDFGPANHPRAQGAVERLGGWLHEVLAQLCAAWPRRWDVYVPVATWIHRITPDVTLKGGASPYRILFGREPRSHIDDLAQALDGSSFRSQGLERSVAESQQTVREVQQILAQRQAAKNQQRERHNERVSRESPGANAKVGDLMLVREASNTLHQDSLHPKLAHDHFTGPWKVVNVVRDHLSFTVQLNGRRIRQRKVAATDMKPFHQRPTELRHPFEDEFAHLVWSADLGLADDSVAAVPLYTLTNRTVVPGTGNVSTAWAWEYQGRYHDGVLSPWITEDETRDSFSPLQLDVFHALWEAYHGPDKARRPPGIPTRGEREVASREDALRQYPLGTKVGREFADSEGNLKIFYGTVYDFCDPHWRVEYPDGDWEELTKRELDKGIGLVAQPSVFPLS